MEDKSFASRQKQLSVKLISKLVNEGIHDLSEILQFIEDPLLRAALAEASNHNPLNAQQGVQP